MSIFKHINGYYGYNFMYKGHRYCRSFSGLPKEVVAQLEIIAKSELIKNNYDISKNEIIYLIEIINDYKEYEKSHSSRVGAFNYVIDDFFKIIGNKNIDNILPNDIQKYINSRINKVKNSTINRELDVIKRIFSLALQNKKLKDNPCLLIEDLRIENPPERILSKEEQEKLLSVANPTMRALIMIALLTTLRTNEILSLKWEDVFLEEKFIIVRNTKNNKIRKIPIKEKLDRELRNLPHLSEYVFTSPVTLSKYKDIKTTFARTVKRAGIAPISYHKLRHTTASRMNEKNVDIVTIQKILDHSDIRTTMVYTHKPSKSEDDAFDKLNDY